jgi:hypothetical protein
MVLIAGRFPKPTDSSGHQARDQHAGVRFMMAVAEPAGVEAAALTALARPAHATWFASGLCTSKICYPGVIPNDFSFRLYCISI